MQGWSRSLAKIGQNWPVPKGINGLSGAPVILIRSPFDAAFDPNPLAIIGFQSSVVSLNDAQDRKVLKIIHWAAMLAVAALAYPGLKDVAKAYGLSW